MPHPQQLIEKSCEICASRFMTRNRKRRTCGPSCANVMSWRNPHTKANRGAGIRRAKNSPEGRLRVNSGNKVRWANPRAREQLSEWNRKRWADPEFKAHRSKVLKELWKTNDKSKKRIADAAVERWRNPKWRAQQTDKIREAKRRPEARAAYSQLLRERWKIPAWRKVWLKRQREFVHDPNTKAQNSERMKELWKDDAFRDNMISKSKVTKAVRMGLLRTARALADQTGCFEACPQTLATAVGVKPDALGAHLAHLEKLGKVMLARPAGVRPALYQLL